MDFRGIYGSDQQPGQGQVSPQPGVADQPYAGFDSGAGAQPSMEVGSANEVESTKNIPKVEQLPLENDAVCKELQRWYDQDSTSPLRINFLKMCKEYHRAYLGEMPATSFPWEDCSNVDLGIIEMAVDNIKSRFKMATIGGKPSFLAQPLSVGAEEVKQDVQELMSSALDQQVEIEKVMDDISFDTVELGNCVVKRRWQKEERTVKVFQKQIVPVRFKTPFLNLFSQNVEQFDLGEEVVTEEKAQVDIISLENILVPESSQQDPQKMHHIMHLYDLFEMDLDELYSKQDTYDQSSIAEAKAHLRKIQPDNKNPRKDKKQNQDLPALGVKCAEVYCKWKNPKTGKNEEMVFNWIIGTKIVLRKVRLVDIFFDGIRPFRWFRYKSSGTVYGRGIVEMLYQYRTALNSVFNMAVNCMFLQIMPWGFYKYGSSFKPDDHRVSPGTWIPLDDINDARVTTFPPTARLADGAVQLLMTFVERQSGISAPQMGQQMTGRKTAFEVRSVLSEGNIKHEERIDAFKDTFGDLLRDLYNLYKFNNPDNAVFRKLYSDDGNMLSKPTFFKPASRMILSQYDFDFIITGTLTTGNKAIERQDATELADWMLRLPIVAENPDAMRELAKDVAVAFGKRDIDRYLPPPEVTKMLKTMKLKELAQMASGQREVAGGPAVVSRRGATPR